MKKETLIYFAFLFCISNLTYSQQEFAPIGAVWTINEEGFWTGNPSEDLSELHTLKATGDTLINNLNMRKVGDWITYQDNFQVYLWHEDSLHLIFDFDVEAGDSIHINQFVYNTSTLLPQSYLVDSVTTLMLNGIPLKRIYCGQSSYAERIGDLSMVIDQTAETDFITPFIPSWLRCYSDNEIDYKTDKFLSYGDLDCDIILGPDATKNFNQAGIKIFPNPTASQVYIELENLTTTKHLDIRLFDLFGKTLLQKSVEYSLPVNIDMTPFSTSVYFLEIKMDGDVFVKKIVFTQ